jgi:hypothetical protein
MSPVLLAFLIPVGMIFLALYLAVAQMTWRLSEEEIEKDGFTPDLPSFLWRRLLLSVFWLPSLIDYAIRSRRGTLRP